MKNNRDMSMFERKNIKKLKSELLSLYLRINPNLLTAEDIKIAEAIVESKEIQDMLEARIKNEKIKEKKSPFVLG